jgi:hypothetical protein
MRQEDIRKLSEAIRTRGERPAAEQRADMIRRGAIDQDGKVILGRHSGPAKDRPGKPGPR